MKYRCKKMIMIITGVFLIICPGILTKLFLIGEPVASEQIYYITSADGRKLNLTVETFESAAALRGWKYRQDGSTLYISARKVLVSPFFREGRYETIINTEEIDQIILGGSTIWSCNPETRKTML